MVVSTESLKIHHWPEYDEDDLEHKHTEQIFPLDVAPIMTQIGYVWVNCIVNVQE